MSASKLTGGCKAYSPNDDRVTAEQLEKLHRGRIESSDRVIIGGRFIDDQAVGTGVSNAQLGFIAAGQAYSRDCSSSRSVSQMHLGSKTQRRAADQTR